MAQGRTRPRPGRQSADDRRQPYSDRRVPDRLRDGMVGRRQERQARLRECRRSRRPGEDAAGHAEPADVDRRASPHERGQGVSVRRSEPAGAGVLAGRDLVAARFSAAVADLRDLSQRRRHGVDRSRERRRRRRRRHARPRNRANTPSRPSRSSRTTSRPTARISRPPAAAAACRSRAWTRPARKATIPPRSIRRSSSSI